MLKACQKVIVTLAILAFTVFKLCHLEAIPSIYVRCLCPTWCDNLHDRICFTCHTQASDSNCVFVQRGVRDSVEHEMKSLAGPQYHQTQALCEISIKVSELKDANITMQVALKRKEIIGFSRVMRFSKSLDIKLVKDECNGSFITCVDNEIGHDAHCLPGWRGANCDQECHDGTFGLSCSKKCHCCKNWEVCEKACGRCETGCAFGWKGEGCQEATDTTNICGRFAGSIGNETFSGVSPRAGRIQKRKKASQPGGQATAGTVIGVLASVAAAAGIILTFVNIYKKTGAVHVGHQGDAENTARDDAK